MVDTDVQIRPESVCQSKGKVFHSVSQNLLHILGEDFLEDMHEKVMDYVHEQSRRQADVAAQINFEAERKKRMQLEEENEVLRRELKRARTDAAACREATSEASGPVSMA